MSSLASPADQLAAMSPQHERVQRQPEDAVGSTPAEAIKWFDTVNGLCGVVPATAVNLSSVTIPTDSANKARIAALFVIEEDVAQDPAQVHVSVGSRFESGAWPVAIVDHLVMQNWMDEIHSMDRSPVALVPECSAIPVIEGEAICIERDELVVVACGAKGGFALEADLFRDVAEDFLLSRNIRRVVIHANRALALVPPTMSQNVEVVYEAALSDEDYADLLASGVSDGTINLLQGQYGPTRSWKERLVQWRLPLSTVALLFLSYVALTFVEGLKMNAEADALQVQTEEIVRRALPDVTRIVNPRTQIQARLRSVDGASDRRFLDLSAVLFEGLSNIRSTRLESLQFVESTGQLSAIISMAAFTDLEKLRTAISTRGFVMVEGGSRTTDGRIISEITVRAL